MNNGCDVKSNQQGGRAAPVSCSWKEVNHGLTFKKAEAWSLLVHCSARVWMATIYVQPGFIFGSLTF